MTGLAAYMAGLAACMTGLTAGCMGGLIAYVPQLTMYATCMAVLTPYMTGMTACDVCRFPDTDVGDCQRPTI